MIDFRYDFTFFIKTVKYIFLPVLAIVLLTALLVYKYSKNVKKKDLDRYNYIVELWTTILALVIISSLFALTVGFSLSIINTIKANNLIKGHELIYYLVVATPSIPFCFFVFYIYRLIEIVLTRKKDKTIKREKTPNFVEIYEKDLVVDNGDNNFDTEKINSSNSSSTDIGDQTLDLTEYSIDSDSNSDDDEIELL